MGTLLYLPLVLTCIGGACGNDRVHTEPPPGLSPVVVTPGGQARVSVPHGSIRLASERLKIPLQRQVRRSGRSQLSIQPKFGGTSKAMLVFAGVVAGMYAGGHLASAMDDSAEHNGALIGMPIGGALGGIIVWQLVR
jgi:hypothetical protein